MLTLAPIGLRQANDFVGQEHRHHPPTTGHKFSVAVVDELGVLRGVGIAGRPVNRHLQAAGYLEILRVCTDGTPNACSMLYGALRRAAKALGYDTAKVITYTLASEPGSSLRAAGFKPEREVKGESWSRVDRPRERHLIADKIRWAAA